MNARLILKGTTVTLVTVLLSACSEYGDFTQEQICRASLAAIKGKSPSIITVDSKSVEAESEAEVFNISYKRPDDGKRWHYRCKLDKKRAIWAQGKDGRWRDQAHDPTIRFEIEGEDILIRETFPDGSTAVDISFNIHMLGGKS